MNRQTSILSFISLFITVLAISFSVTAQENGSWKLVKEKSGIKVYNKESSSSKLKDSRAIMTIDCQLETAKSEFLSVATHKDWMDRVIISDVLQKVSPTEFIAYYEAQAPWPVSNRDVVSHYTIRDLPNGGLRLDVLAKPDFIPEKKSKVRIQDAVSSWTITPAENDQVEIVYENHADPGGSIPDWLANSSSTSSPLNTMKALKERLVK